MVTLGRFELPTSGLGNRCSIQLSYRATENKGLNSTTSVLQPFGPFSALGAG